MLKGFFIASLLLKATALFQPHTSDHQHPKDGSDQIIIKFKTNASGVGPNAHDHLKTKVHHWLDNFGSSMVSFKKNTDYHVVRLDAHHQSSQLQKLLDKVNADPDVEFAEIDQILYPMLVPNDPNYPQQWHYGSNTGPTYGINLPGGWDISTGSSSVVVAVLDTGILPHPDLVGNILPGYDMIDNVLRSRDGDGRDNDPTDPGDWTFTKGSTWHGTHVAGTIAAVTDNRVGVAGVAWKSKIVPVRFLSGDGGYSSDLAAAILWAAGLEVPGIPNNPNPAKVISISAGGLAQCDTPVQSAVSAAVGAGSVVIVAAGNSAADAVSSLPANCKDVLVVGAHGPSGTLASYSNFGPKVDILAPGGDNGVGVLSTSNEGRRGPTQYGYLFSLGTSMATPHVSGLAALMLAVNPNLFPADIKDIIKATAKTVPDNRCLGNRCGAGLADAQAALAYVAQMSPLPPPPVNDNCPQATQLPCDTIVRGSTRRATPQDGVSGCMVNEVSFSANVWYVLDLPTSTNVRISTCNTGTNFDTMISVYSGSCPGSLSCVAGQNDGPPSCGSATSLTLSRQSGMRWIMVHGYGAATGDFALSVQCSSNNNFGPVTQYNPPSSDSPSASPLSPSPSPVSSSQSPSSSPSREALSGSPSPSPGSASPSLSPLRPSASPTPLPSPSPFGRNDECTAAIPVTCGSSVSGNTLFATVSLNKPDCVPGATSQSNDLWYSLQLSQPTVLRLSTCDGTNFDSMISVFSGTCDTLSCASGGNDGCDGGQVNLVTPPLSGTVLIMVHGFQSAAGRFNLNVECTAAQPAAPVQPVPVAPISILNNIGCSSAATVQCGRRYSSRTGFNFFNYLQSTCVANTPSSAERAWFAITLPQRSTLTLSTCYAATQFDTMISLFVGTCNRLTCIAGVDDIGGQCGVTSGLTLPNLQGTIFIMVHGYSTEAGAFELSVDC